MVLTLIAFGAVFGRWWRAALPASAVAWPALLLATGTMSLEPALIGAAGLAALNTAAGAPKLLPARAPSRRPAQHSRESMSDDR